MACPARAPALATVTIVTINFSGFLLDVETTLTCQFSYVFGYMIVTKLTIIAMTAD